MWYMIVETAVIPCLLVVVRMFVHVCNLKRNSDVHVDSNFS